MSKTMESFCTIVKHFGRRSFVADLHHPPFHIGTITHTADFTSDAEQYKANETSHPRLSHLGRREADSSTPAAGIPTKNGVHRPTAPKNLTSDLIAERSCALTASTLRVIDSCRADPSALDHCYNNHLSAADFYVQYAEMIARIRPSAELSGHVRSFTRGLVPSGAAAPSAHHRGGYLICPTASTSVYSGPHAGLMGLSCRPKRGPTSALTARPALRQHPADGSLGLNGICPISAHHRSMERSGRLAPSTSRATTPSFCAPLLPYRPLDVYARLAVLTTTNDRKGRWLCAEQQIGAFPVSRPDPRCACSSQSTPPASHRLSRPPPSIVGSPASDPFAAIEPSLQRWAYGDQRRLLKNVPRHLPKRSRSFQAASEARIYGDDRRGHPDVLMSNIHLGAWIGQLLVDIGTPHQGQHL
jgi:hypothetical protein